MTGPSEKPVVFVVDDDALVREAIADLLQSVGLEVRLFASPGEFLKTRRVDAPGCLVLDVRLPEQSGLDFQEALVGTDMEVPIVFITGHGNTSPSTCSMPSLRAIASAVRRLSPVTMMIRRSGGPPR